jgi:glycosyltransferase involved in cell wall biosynthesis
MPAVSVVIDTYNHASFIEEALVSVLGQDFPAAETDILVVDDGSTDATPEIVKNFAPRVRYFRKENGGQASAFNFVVPETRGKIVAFLDGDDWWKKNKVSSIVAAFAQNPAVGVVGHGIIQIDSATGQGSVLSPEHPGAFDLRSNSGAQTFRDYMCFLGTSRVAIRREILNKILPIPEELVIEADEFMSAMAIAFGGALLLEEPLTYYRLHDQNLYQFRDKDFSRMRRKYLVLASLAKELFFRLQSAGISPEAIEIIVAPIRVAATRMKLALNGGWPWETYRAEKSDLRLAYRDTSFGYRAYKELSLLATLLLPPRVFYQMRDWYSQKDLRRFRRWLGDPVPAAAVHEKPLATVPRTPGSAA